MNISIKREQNNARISSAEREKLGAKLKTKNIFKVLALAMLMPAMLLTTACSNDDEAIVNNETTNKKGYPLQVTVNVSREGDAGTRATYTDNGNGTGSLAFSTGDKLFVYGDDAGVASGFAGTLDYDAVSGKFTGTIYTQNSYSGTADALFTAASDDGFVNATLLPAGYGSYGYLYIRTYDDVYEYNDEAAQNNTYTLATSKAAGVEQFSYEKAISYSSGFALTPKNAILNFTITGLTASTDVAVSLTGSGYTITKTVTTDGSGNATFAAGVSGGKNLNNFSLTVGGNPITLVTESKTLTAGKIYNITRSAAPAPAATDLSTINADYTASDGETLTGTLGANVKISIADGATVILNNVSINADGSWTSGNYAGITCEGDATIILSGTNTVKGFYEDYPGIYVPENKTVTIQGTGSLTACSNGYGAGIGGGFGISCGNIEIQGGVITATGGWSGAGIGAGSGVGSEVGTGESICGTITISGGTVTAIGGYYAAGIGSGYAQTNPSTCGAISISGGTVSATAGALAPAAIGKGAVDVGESTCASVTITPDITSLTLTNTNSGVTGIVSDFINAGAFNADTNPITYMLPTSVTDPTITGGMDYFGFTTSYNEGAKTWTITKK